MILLLHLSNDCIHSLSLIHIRQPAPKPVGAPRPTRARSQAASGRSQAKLVTRSRMIPSPSLARVANEESLPRNYSSRELSFYVVL